MTFTLLSRMGDELPIPVSVTDNIDELIYYLENHNVYRSCVGIITPQGLDLNNLPRHTKTGEIKDYATPKQLRAHELAVYLYDTRKGRPQNANLNSKGRKKAPNWTSTSRPNKPRRISDESVEIAHKLRAEKVKWKEIARVTKTSLEGIRSAVNTRGLKEMALPHP